MSSKPSLILHPGHSKCGSSSIQNALYTQSGHLEKQGVYLPDSKFQFQFEETKAQAKFTYPLMFFKDVYEGTIELSQFQERLETVLQQAADSDCKSIIISAENLSLLSRIPRNHQIHEILAASFQTIKIVYYVRRQDDWIVSCWQQWGHKDGSSLDQVLNRFSSKNIPTFLEVVSALKEVYEEAELSVVPLHKSALKGENLISDFYQRAGLGMPTESIKHNIANSAFSPYFCEVLSAIPNLYNSIHDNSIKSLLNKYVSDQSPIFNRHKDFLPLNLRHKIMAHFYQDNKELHQQFFPSLDFDELFGIEEPPANGAEPSEIDTLKAEVEALKEVTAIQTEILISLVKRNHSYRRQ